MLRKNNWMNMQVYNALDLAGFRGGVSRAHMIELFHSPKYKAVSVNLNQ